MFIVLEGLDGAGKSTQIKMLENHFSSTNRKCKFMHFPRYEMPFFGELVAKFLRGDLGKIDNVNAYVIAMLFAGNRSEVSAEIEAWLSQNYIVIVDRYVYSNIAFQCAKLKTANEQIALRDWIFRLEYEYFKIPKPDISIFLDVPLSFVERKLNANRKGDDRDYLQGKKDIHEADIEFQRQVRDIYLQQQQWDDNFKIVDCGNEQGEMRTPQENFERIKSCLERENKI